jgi:hypothetical protein
MAWLTGGDFATNSFSCPSEDSELALCSPGILWERLVAVPLHFGAQARESDVTLALVISENWGGNGGVARVQMQIRAPWLPSQTPSRAGPWQPGEGGLEWSRINTPSRLSPFQGLGWRVTSMNSLGKGGDLGGRGKKPPSGEGRGNIPRGAGAIQVSNEFKLGVPNPEFCHPWPEIHSKTLSQHCSIARLAWILEAPYSHSPRLAWLDLSRPAWLRLGMPVTQSLSEDMLSLAGGSSRSVAGLRTEWDPQAPQAAAANQDRMLAFPLNQHKLIFIYVQHKLYAQFLFSWRIEHSKKELAILSQLE